MNGTVPLLPTCAFVAWTGKLYFLNAVEEICKGRGSVECQLSQGHENSILVSDTIIKRIIFKCGFILAIHYMRGNCDNSSFRGASC
jgi:hypothetical protein